MRLRFDHHHRFIVSLVVGLGVFAAAEAIGWPRARVLRALLAGDLFFAIYLALTVGFVRKTTAPALRARAANPDEGLPVILLVTGATVVSSLAAVLLLMSGGTSGILGLSLAIAAVPLGWLTLHTMVAFHYANLYYMPVGRGDAGGLAFPKTPEPGLLDFLYYSFVIGMTAQVSDVDVTSREQRRMTLIHGVFSFFYNAGILALAVNATANLRG
jgi:uncharacterized membrane protein